MLCSYSRIVDLFFINLTFSQDKSSTNNASNNASANNSVDDKKKHIKSLIEKIPTDKTALFEYSIDWDLVDNQLMEKRIRPWINKKIAEYIGEPEPSLTDFICSKVIRLLIFLLKLKRNCNFVHFLNET